MRLLFDQNLSDRLVRTVADVFPGSIHVRDIGLAASSDSAVWEYALNNGLAIISKDGDFHRNDSGAHDGCNATLFRGMNAPSIWPSAER